LGNNADFFVPKQPAGSGNTRYIKLVLLYDGFVMMQIDVGLALS
jgi:hypothetical protein